MKGDLRFSATYSLFLFFQRQPGHLSYPLIFPALVSRLKAVLSVTQAALVWLLSHWTSRFSSFPFFPSEAREGRWVPFYFYNHSLQAWVLRYNRPVAHRAFCPCYQHSSAQFRGQLRVSNKWFPLGSLFILHWYTATVFCWQALTMYNPILLGLYTCTSWLSFNGWLYLPSAPQSTQNSPESRTFPDTTKWEIPPT